MHLGLTRTIAVFSCCLAFVCASSLREPSSNGLETNQSESETKNGESLRDSETSVGHTVNDEAASKTLSLRSNLRKKRNMKYSALSGEQPTIASLRTIWNSHRPARDGIGSNLIWDRNTGVALKGKPSRNNNRAFGRGLEHKRVCFKRRGVVYCERSGKAEMNNDMARNLKDTEYISKMSENALAREIYEYEVESLRNKLQAMRRENLQELLRSDVDPLLAASRVENVPVSPGGDGQKRSELSALVEGDEARVRPQFYPNDGPKRDWKVNLMRVWG